MKSVIRKQRFWIMGALIVIVGLVYLLLRPVGNHEVLFAKKNDILQVGNSHYNIAFNAKTGSIEYMTDRLAKENLTEKNRGGALWWAFMGNDASINSLIDTKFTYDWSRKKDELVLHYSGPVKVDVTVNFSGSNRIYMKAKVMNQTKDTLKSFRFPYELKVAADQITDGMLPMLPGAKLKPAFFTTNNSFDDQYPGVMFASYIALQTKNGSLAMYDLNTQPIATINLGFNGQNDDPGKTGLVHNYKTWILPNKEWQSPSIVMEIGGNYATSITSYRELNHIDQYPSISEKLGKDWAQYAQLPFLKLDISALKDVSWSQLKTKYIDKLDYGNVFHLIGFQTGGHDENYPDFMPPDPSWGGMDDFKAFIQAAQAKGNRVVPYTNFSWWGINSPTLSQLPASSPLTEIMVRKQSSENIKEDYGAHSGYVVNINDPYVMQRNADEHKKLLDAGVDGIFEDQWGIRNSPYVYNKVIPKNADPSSAYFEGVRNYFKASAKQKMYTEDGTDVLAQDSIGFMGTNYLWDKLGYRANTEAFTEYYPLIGMLQRDKVMLYQHDLAAQTMTDNKDMLRWNMAMGYNLGGDLFNGTDNVWIDLIDIFQKFVLANYGDALVKEYKQISPTLTETDFAKYKVTANWDSRNPYAMGADWTLAPGGFDAVSSDLQVRAGSYSRFGGVDLDPGEHYLVEIRDNKQIRVFQPVGSDTTLKVQKVKAWPHVQAAAFQANGTKIANIPLIENGDSVQFDYIAKILDKKVGYIGLTEAASLNNIKDVPFHKVKSEINIALKKPAVSTTDTAKEFPGSLATDGDPFTYWESIKENFPQSLTIDLEQKQKVKKVILKLPPKDEWALRNQDIQVLGSEDGQKFTELLPEKSYAFDPKVLNVVEIPLKETETRYLRIVVTSNSGWPAAQIAEFEVY